jgi:lysozyme
LLDGDVVSAEVAVNNYVKVPLTQEQFDSLVSFTMNLGSGSLQSSTLLRLLNQNDYDGAAGQFKRWVYGNVNGSYVVLPGLVIRREKERKLFMGGDI